MVVKTGACAKRSENIRSTPTELNLICLILTRIAEQARDASSLIQSSNNELPRSKLRGIRSDADSEQRQLFVV